MTKLQMTELHKLSKKDKIKVVQTFLMVWVVFMKLLMTIKN